MASKGGRAPQIEVRGHTARRDFIKYSVAVGALLGLDRARLFDVTARTAGQAMADEMACAPTNRSVHLIAGTGGFAWFQLLWPHNDVAAAMDPNFAFHAPGQQVMAQGSDKPLTLGPEAPWRSRGSSKFVSAFMSGTNETHTQRPTSSSTIATGTGLFATCAALQASSPTLIPAIGVNLVPYGTAPGAPSVASVANADGLVDLFNSAAARAMGTLANGKDAALFEAYYKAFLGLNAAAPRATMARGLRTGKVASNLLGRNLADQLRPTSTDLGNYGVNGGSPSKLMELAKALITTAKAFKLGLTSSVIIPCFNDDPHGAFNDMNALSMTVGTLGKILDGFMNDLEATDDPSCAGSKLGAGTVLSIHGDTPKDPLQRSGWPDGTPGNSNWVYALGAGWLKTGWFGGVKRDGSVAGFDPSTGKDTPGQMSSQTAQSASAAIAYAVARGDMRRVNDFYRGVDIAGVVRPKQQ